MADPTQVGALVWVRQDPLADPATAPPIRGGTVVDFDPVALEVTVLNTGLTTANRRQVAKVKTSKVSLEELDPDSIDDAQFRMTDRTRLARHLFRAVSERTSKERDEIDEQYVGWALQLWEPPFSAREEALCQAR